MHSDVFWWVEVQVVVEMGHVFQGGFQWDRVGAVQAFLGAVGAWFLGRWLNQKRPFAKLEEWKAQRRVELCSLVDQGQFQIAPGAPAPTSREEGYAQVEELLEREARDLLPRMLNQHSLYGVPLHMVGLVIGVLTLGGFIASFFTS